jgi:hypothetical protein
VAKRTKQPSKLRFAAKLLFQSRIVFKGRSNRRRLCEERIVVISASSAEMAHRLALKRGKSGEFEVKGLGGRKIYQEFVGILALKHLGAECEPGEVWYEFRRLLLPKERASRLIPPKAKLAAF